MYLVFDCPHIIYFFQHRAMLCHSLHTVVSYSCPSSVHEIVIGDDDILVRT